MEPRRVLADSYHFDDEQDSDPHQSEKRNPDLDPHQGDADPQSLFEAVLRIRIRMILGLLDPDQDLLVRGMDPGPSIIKQNGKKNVDSVL
jgi:hypothetical protein